MTGNEIQTLLDAQRAYTEAVPLSPQRFALSS